MSRFENEANEHEGNENHGNGHEANEHGGGVAGLSLNGGENDRELAGGDGDDVLTGNGGALTLTGGLGTNTFNIQAGEDTLADAKPGTDNINISSGATAIQNLTLTSADYSANTANSGTLVINGLSTAPSTIVGSSGHDRIKGGDHDDHINGGDGDDEFNESAGNDFVVGGVGINQFTYSGRESDYHRSRDAEGNEHVQKLSFGGTDTLSNVQRLHFADSNVAMDIDGHAGIAAKILGAVFGASAVANPTYAGIGLTQLDNGMSYETLMQLALSAAGATTSHQIVNLLWSNLVGTAPSSDDAAPFVEMLDSGSTTPATLGTLAADSSLNANNINLVGLQQTGLHYA